MSLIFYIIAIGLFVLAGLQVGVSRVNFIGLGLASFALAHVL